MSFFFQAEDGIRDAQESRGLGDVYKRQRSDWWLVQLANLIISFLTIPIFLKTFGFNVYGIVCIIPQIAIDVRRIKDFGKDWKWIFINLIPILGWILWFIWLGFGKTGNGKNKLI